MDALFVPDWDRLVPTELVRGPWRPDAQHGGPPSALLGRATEVEATHVGGRVARIGVELVRPVPLAPLRCRSRRVAVSRRVTSVEAELVTGSDELVARSRALVLHVRPMEPRGEVAGPDDRPSTATDLGGPMWAAGSDLTTYHRDAVEHRFVSGGPGQPGPAVDWVRLRVPLVAGEETSGLCRTLATADFGSGISAVFPGDGDVGMINADLEVALHREPAGEWLRLDATTRVGPAGVGLCTTLLGDAEGEVGVATQSLLPLTVVRDR